MKFLLLPVSVVGGLLAGLIGKKVFDTPTDVLPAVSMFVIRKRSGARKATLLT